MSNEAADYLKIYIELRRQISSEKVLDNSPLIQHQGYGKIEPMTPAAISAIIHNLYVKAGILSTKQNARRFEISPYGLRKFFLTQMIALGVNRDYAEYMMGHKLSSYHTVQSLGIEYLRAIYLSSGLSIKPRTKQNKIKDLNRIIQLWGLDPKEILSDKTGFIGFKCYKLQPETGLSPSGFTSVET